MIIAIDTSYLCYKYLYGIKDNKEKHESLKQMMITLVDLSLVFGAKTKFAFCFDSKIMARREIYPEYKVKRAETREKMSEEEKIALKEMYEDLVRLKDEWLPEFGFKNIFYQEGYESDDLIAEIVLSNPCERIYIMASDKDLYQLLDKNVSMITLKGTSFEVFNLINFKNKFNCSPKQWLEAKYIWGCKSDNIPSISPQDKIGEVSALKYILGELKTTLKVYNAIKSNISSQAFIRNKKLIQLPYEGTQKIEFQDEVYSLSNIQAKFQELFPSTWAERKVDIYNFCEKHNKAK